MRVHPSNEQQRMHTLKDADPGLRHRLCVCWSLPCVQISHVNEAQEKQVHLHQQRQSQYKVQDRKGTGGNQPDVKGLITFMLNRSSHADVVDLLNLLISLQLVSFPLTSLCSCSGTNKDVLRRFVQTSRVSVIEFYLHRESEIIRQVRQQFAGESIKQCKVQSP